jgi:formylglycine-generating enzyme required for sulfatase activity
MGKEHPVDQVSWNDAQEFIQKLISLNKGKYHFRLPTEAEWEYAARSGGQPHKYSGGKNFSDHAWYSANSGMISKPVGQKLPNALGIYDMSGNVYEWCCDIYSDTAYKKHEKDNPVITGEGVKRVIRGGSWSNSPHEVRCAYRASVHQEFKGNYIGFRVVMTAVSRKKIIS